VHRHIAEGEPDAAYGVLWMHGRTIGTYEYPEKRRWFLIGYDVFRVTTSSVLSRSVMWDGIMVMAEKFIPPIAMRPTEYWVDILDLTRTGVNHDNRG